MPPQATQELRTLWGGEDGIGDDKATDFLLSKGWKMKPHGLWHAPLVTTNLEWEAIQFLIDEWDHSIAEEDRDF